MDRKNLSKIERDLNNLLRSPGGIKSKTLISIAKKLGRVLDNRGKEPTYIRTKDPSLSPPLSIPNHKGKDLKTGTARSIIDALINDVDEWKLYFETESKK
ncbi:type II toxin-antitoxin system HicA family toxin [Nitrosomonas ureae]|uniref:Uncharacterized protein n=1 Tax=Nitrosomonas ureae TaxID=44577 RepID=A0A286AKU7_9PROT|nr:type II toxin-antitoxin system HicA family toxin [Nitrosomonas ureae]SOD22538.1 hypothetical protein SAMN06297164_3500 [Nitrosomonas ureae]